MTTFQGVFGDSFFSSKKIGAVDKKRILHQLRLVAYPIIYKV